MGWPRDVLIFDTETKTDTTQRLLFGGYRHCQWTEKGDRLMCREEGFFYPDDLPKTDPKGFRFLQEFVRTHEAEVCADVPRRLRLRSRTEFVNTVFWRLAYKSEALVVGFNLPFDLSRLAVHCGAARGHFRGGFSFIFWGRREGRRRKWHAHPHRPRIHVKHLDRKKSFIEFGRCKTADPENEQAAEDHAPDFQSHPRGRFLDLKTLAFALTNEAYTLKLACKEFQVKHPKTKAERHGVITPENIEYNRRDVLAPQELLEKLRQEFDRHPIKLDPCKAYSPASIAKAYLQEMGLRLPAEQFSSIPREMMGYAMSAFYGGRAECRIRKTPVPVVHTDFTSMYPTVQSLMGLWELISAEEIDCVEATEEVQQLLSRVSVDECFRQETWPELVGFAQVVPQGEVLPHRAKYLHNEWTVGVNHLTGKEPLWYALPDLVDEVLRTGRPPKILHAFRLHPRGRQRLKPVQMRGEVRVDPRTENPFRAVIEQRQRVKHEDKRTERFLKVFANAASYGIFVQMDRDETPKNKPAKVTAYGRAGGFSCRTTAPEDPGNFCFPPIGAVITAAARLMLALLERCVTDAGGSYALADTDSMAIVASREGGLVACEGGAYQLPDGSPAIRALSWSQVDAIVAHFEALNPYDRSAVPGSILKIEKVNFGDRGEQRELFAYVISTKRYALFTIDAGGRPLVPDTKDAYSEHGLGQLLNPLDPELEDHKWIRQTWEGLVWEALGGPRYKPPWGGKPAMMKSAVSTPGIHYRFAHINRDKPYAKQVKPFNFLLSATVAAHEWPPGAHELGGFHLIAPYSSKSSEWQGLDWTDLHSGRVYRIKSHGHSNRGGIRVQTFKDVIDRFRYHPESKSAGPDGLQADEETVGLLGRLHVDAISITHIGKESNLIEQQEERILIADPQAVYWGEDEWETVRPYLNRVSISHLSRLSGVPERRLREYRQGARRPSAKRLRKIMEALAEMLDEAEC
jgi:hypothetical protein